MYSLQQRLLKHNLSLLAVTCHLLIIFANSLVPDQDDRTLKKASSLKLSGTQLIYLLVYKALVCLFDLILYDPVNTFSVMSGPVFLGCASTKQR